MCCEMTEIPHVSLSELHPTVQADVRYNASLVEGLEIPWWLVPALIQEAMDYKLLATRGRRLMIVSWKKVPQGAVYTRWLREMQMAWLAQQLGRVVRDEEIRWFFALNTVEENPEKELLDWVSAAANHSSLSRQQAQRAKASAPVFLSAQHMDNNGRIRSCWSLGEGAIAFRVQAADGSAAWQNAQALSLMHGSIYTMGLTASGNDKGPVRHRTWPAHQPNKHRVALFLDFPVDSHLPATTTPLSGLPANLPMPPAPADHLLTHFKSVDFVVRATPGLVWDESVSAHFGGLQSQENRANLGLPSLLPWPQDVCMTKDIVEIEQGVHEMCSRGGSRERQPWAAHAIQSLQDWQSGRLAAMLFCPQQPPNMPGTTGTIVGSRSTEQAKLHHLEGVLKKTRMPKEHWLQERKRYLELYDPKRLSKPQPKKPRSWLATEKRDISTRLFVA